MRGRGVASKAARPDLVVSASDISADAIDLARENARRLDLDVEFAQVDGLPPGDFALVVASLPYTDSDQVTQQLPPEQTRFQPGVALWAGRDSLALIRRLVHESLRGPGSRSSRAPHHTRECMHSSTAPPPCATRAATSE